jgi:hypothetical protein
MSKHFIFLLLIFFLVGTAQAALFNNNKLPGIDISRTSYIAPSNGTCMLNGTVDGERNVITTASDSQINLNSIFKTYNYPTLNGISIGETDRVITGLYNYYATNTSVVSSEYGGDTLYGIIGTPTLFRITTNGLIRLENNVLVWGDINATRFIGDGSLLTGITAGGNASWNETRANSLYYSNTNPSGYYNITTLPTSSSKKIYKTDLRTINATGLTFVDLYNITLTANKNYTVDCYILRSTNVTSSGIRYNMTLAGVPDWMVVSEHAYTTQTAVQTVTVLGASQSLMPSAVASGLVYPSVLMDRVYIIIDGNANTGGTAKFQFSGEAANLLAIVNRGSYCELEERE